jgi:prepilin-type N-terminal cleavage/methylation domain-containing protein
MIQNFPKIPAKIRNEKGFTLIEMAIVLIIIGIIIGAVVKGKDVIKSAEQKRLYSSWIREWQTVYNNYYDRTGWILGDLNTNDNTGGTRDGYCSGATEANLNSQLANVGLNPPAQGPTGLTNVRTYTDSNGVQHRLTLLFLYNANLGNYIRVTATNGFPVDMGLSWDRIIDGTKDGTAGDLQYDSDRTPAATQVVWPSASAGSPAASCIYIKLEF